VRELADRSHRRSTAAGEVVFSCGIIGMAGDGASELKAP
jgi:hypothetical protein